MFLFPLLTLKRDCVRFPTYLLFLNLAAYSTVCRSGITGELISDMMTPPPPPIANSMLVVMFPHKTDIRRLVILGSSHSVYYGKLCR